MISVGSLNFNITHNCLFSQKTLAILLEVFIYLFNLGSNLFQCFNSKKMLNKLSIKWTSGFLVQASRILENTRILEKHIGESRFNLSNQKSEFSLENGVKPKVLDCGEDSFSARGGGGMFCGFKDLSKKTKFSQDEFFGSSRGRQCLHRWTGPIQESSKCCDSFKIQKLWKYINWNNSRVHRLSSWNAHICTFHIFLIKF